MSVDVENVNLAYTTIVIVEDDPNSYRSTMSLLKMAQGDNIVFHEKLSFCIGVAFNTNSTPLFFKEPKFSRFH